VAISKEVERLRAAGIKGVHRIRVKDKDYDIDLDNYKTVKESCEWTKHCHTSSPSGYACHPPSSPGPERAEGTRRAGLVTRGRVRRALTWGRERPRGEAGATRPSDL
jgi:hypothetical protein